MILTRRNLIGAAPTLATGLIIGPGQTAPRTSATPIVDLHSHWISPSAVAALSARSFGPRITVDADGTRALHRSTAGQSTPPFPLGPQWFDIDARLRHLDEIGVVHQLLSWPTTLGIDPAISAAESRTLWRSYNDDLAIAVRSAPRQLSGLAVLSTSDIAWSAEELKRAHGDLGLIGAVLPVNGFASLEAARHFAPVFEVAQREKSHVFLHTGFAHQTVPGQPVSPLHADAIETRGALDTATQFASSVITLAYTDFLDAYPDITIQVAMLGGSGVAALIAEATSLPGRTGEPRKSRFDRLVLDTGAAGQGPAAIAAASRILGAKRIVFGSDFAPGTSIAPVIANVRAARLAPADETQVFYENARRILGHHGVSLPEISSALRGRQAH
ncbi:amidohydrolase family protein [Sphingomonas sp. AP4-R1]|uniref:amidohydrolase family protein n=1 Tax=Sphingomonas sp. AP4-R1 TaxID=2735134 RepID=UPI001493CD54|nr:amidohydrolase family protein [Sphingomonas sp. AP4-R1]QJU58350.1 amidohydrolase family protein [Sphingomonas sp. AP4-R1]